MITGVHAMVCSADAERTRVFFRDTLGLEFVDADGGWLIFALPPAELAAHPSDAEPRHELYLMCEDIHAAIDELTEKSVEFVSEMPRSFASSSSAARSGSPRWQGGCAGLLD